MTPLFVFTADLHLEDGAWSTRPGIYGDAYYSFRQIIDYCIKYRLPLILGGDVLERKSNAARPIAKLCEGLSRMESEDLEVFYIQGNHEYDRNAPWLSVHGWPVHIHKLSMPYNIRGAQVYGLDWLPRGEIQTALQEVPPSTDILITHQVWKDFMGEVGRTECSLSDVHHVTTILAGDFHVTTEVTADNAQGQKVRMYSPGSICMQDLGESSQKFFHVVGREDSGKISIQKVPLETRRFANYVVKTQEALDELCAGKLAFDIEIAATDAEILPEEIKKPIFRIKFDKALPDAFLRLSTAAGDDVHLFCEALADKVQAANKTSNRSGSRNDLLAALGDLLGEDSQEYKLAAALVNAEDPAKELEAFFKAFFTEDTHAIVETGSPELGTSSVSGV